jgi:hypothetical protein
LKLRTSCCKVSEGLPQTQCAAPASPSDDAEPEGQGIQERESAVDV